MSQYHPRLDLLVTTYSPQTPLYHMSTYQSNKPLYTASILSLVFLDHSFLMLALLDAHYLKYEHIISITLLLRDMSDFPIINPIYASYFKSPLPPARVTISPPIKEAVNLSAIISTSARTGLHVQSRSYWAPANIGPYSQAISVCLSLMKLI